MDYEEKIEKDFERLNEKIRDLVQSELERIRLTVVKLKQDAKRVAEIMG